MERVIPFNISVAFALILLDRNSHALVAISLSIIESNNCYPSSLQSKFIIHSKSNFYCDYTAGRNSVTLDECVDSTTSYLKNRKSTECPNNDLSPLGLFVRMVVLKSGSFNNRAGNMSLPQIRRLLV